MTTPIRKIVIGENHRSVAVLNRPVEDILSGSGYSSGGEDFAGFSTVAALAAEATARGAGDSANAASITTNTAGIASAAATLASQRMGLYDPNPGAQRLIGYPTVMASPPTITVSTGFATIGAVVSTIASGVYTAANALVNNVWVANPAGVPWRYLNGTVAIQGQGGNNGSFVGGANVASVGVNSSSFAVEFETDALAFEFLTKSISASAFYRMLVDGQYVALAPTAGPSADSNLYLVKATFASRVNRRIRIEFANNITFGGLYVGPNDTIWQSSVPTGPRAIVLGDSITSGTGATSTLSGFVDTVAKLLGWRDCWQSGIGGTGYLAATTFRTRAAADVVARAPDIVIVAGGINDVGVSSAAAIQAEAGLLFAQIRAGLPNVKLIVVGNFARNGSPSANEIAVRDAIKTATNADTGAHLFVDNLVATSAGANTLGWITGTGKVGTTTGSGNADLYVSADGTHPAQAGHDYLGRRLAAAIAAGMPL